MQTVPALDAAVDAVTAARGKAKEGAEVVASGKMQPFAACLQVRHAALRC
jgi:hypothetical protein